LVSLILPLSGGNSAAAERALHSLSLACQRNVRRDEYEIIVIERPSADVLGELRAKRADADVRYAVVESSSRGLELEPRSASLIGWLLEPAIVTPRVVEHAILAARIASEPLIVVPTYDLVASDTTVARGTAEDDLWSSMSRSGTGEYGAYRLFDRVQFSALNPAGYLADTYGATLFFHRPGADERWPDALEIGGADTARDLYRRLRNRPETRVIVLGGEGCFRSASVANAPALSDPTPDDRREPLLFGVLPGLSHLHFRRSLKNAPESEPGSVMPPPAEALGSADHAPKAPKVSIVLVVYDMPRQAENTVHSLSTRFQRGVRADDYEVIVVENRSGRMLGRDRAVALGGNVRYFERDDKGMSPAPALNFGIAQARAPAIGLMIDGARMVTPRLVEHVLMGLRVFALPLIVAPGYHLGPKPQHVSTLSGYGESVEQELLRGIDWKSAGYRLFEIACVDGTNENGFLNPLLESTCIFCPRSCLQAIGGVDERFKLAGGGIVNLDIFDRLCRLDGTRVVMLWAEGAFHQYHGGVSSRSLEQRELLLETFRQEYEQLRGRRFSTWERQPVLLGTNAAAARALSMFSAWYGRIRYDMSVTAGTPEWPRD
jgi:hypothetical protein